MEIKIDNLTEAQEIAIEHMLYMFQYLGGVGSSRTIKFFADGDGNFRPKITIDGNKPKKFVVPESSIKKPFTRESLEKFDLDIDFDNAAWLLHKHKKSELQK